MEMKVGRTSLVVAMAAAVALTAAGASAGERAAGAFGGDGSGGNAGWLLRQANVPSVGGVVVAGLQDETGGAGGAAVEKPRGGRNKVLPLAMSLVMPGLGEAYLGHVRGYPMMAIDVGAWILLAHYNTLGIRKRDEYYAYAQQHWSLPQLAAAYDTNNPADAAGLFYFPGFNITSGGLDAYQQIPLWVSEAADRREYFENLGKWDPFVFGWDDFLDPRLFPEHPAVNSGDAFYLKDPRASAHREVYRSMRKDSNDQFTKRDRVLYFNIATRIFSFFQVAYLEGLLGGGPKSPLAVGGHPVRLIAEPTGLTGTRLGMTVDY